MQRRVSFLQQFIDQPRSISKKHLIMVALAIIFIGFYYIGDGSIFGTADTFPSFLYGQAYHELVLLSFSGIVIYAAVVLRTRLALIVSFIGFFLVLPHAFIMPAYPDPMYRISSWLAINILLSLVISGALNTREHQQMYLREIVNTQEQERYRLSRELHDDTAQGLIDAAHAIDEILELSHPSEDVVESLNSLRQDIDEILENTRRAIQGLQPPLLDEVGIKPAILWLCDTVSEESDIEVNTDIDLSEQQLTQEVKTILFRVTQEALANIKKHSEASRIEVVLKSDENKVTVSISDNGKGFTLGSRGKLRSERKSGLIGIQERVGLVHGSFDLRSKVGEGTAIKVEIPI